MSKGKASRDKYEGDPLAAGMTCIWMPLASLASDMKSSWPSNTDYCFIFYYYHYLSLFFAIILKILAILCYLLYTKEKTRQIIVLYIS